MKKKNIKKAGIYIGAIILVIWSVAPVLWMFISSATPGNEIIDASKLLPSHFTLDRYRMIFLGAQIEGVNRNAGTQSMVFRQALVNSTIVAVLTTAISIAIGTSASYAFSRLKFKGRSFLSFAALFFQLLPPIALLVPYYIVVSKMGMLDKLQTIVLVNEYFTLRVPLAHF